MFDWAIMPWAQIQIALSIIGGGGVIGLIYAVIKMVGWANKLRSRNTELETEVVGLRAKLDVNQERLDLLKDRREDADRAIAAFEKEIAQLKARYEAGASREEIAVQAKKLGDAATVAATANAAVASSVALVVQDLTTSRPFEDHDVFGKSFLTQSSDKKEH